MLIKNKSVLLNLFVLFKKSRMPKSVIIGKFVLWTKHANTFMRAAPIVKFILFVILYFSINILKKKIFSEKNEEECSKKGKDKCVWETTWNEPEPISQCYPYLASCKKRKHKNSF